MSSSLSNLPEEELEDLNGLSQQGQGLNFRPFLRLVVRKAWLIIGLTSLTTFAAWLSSSQDSYNYTGSFYLLVEPITSSAKLTNPTTLARTEGVPDEKLFELDYPTNLVFLQSPGMTLRIAQDVYSKESARTVPSIWKDLRENLKVERASLEGGGRSGDTKIFQVSYTGTNTKEVQDILSTAADTFVKYSAEDRETNIKAGVKFIDAQLPDLQQRLQKLRMEQENLRRKNELVDPLPKNNEILTQVSNLQQQQLVLSTQLQSQKQLSKTLQEQLKLTPPEALAAATLSQDPNRVALLAQLQELDSQIAIASATFTDDSPQVQDLKDKRQNIFTLLTQTTQAILAKNALVISPDSAALSFQDPTRLQLIAQLIEANNQILVLETQLQSMGSAKEEFVEEAKRYPGLINRYSDIEGQIKLTEEILNKLLLQRETLKVEAAQELPWQLISEPQIPLDAEGNPIGEPPNRKKKLMMGIVGGLVLGIGMAFLWEKRQNLFHTADDIPDILSIPLLGNIPKDDRHTGLLPDLKLDPKFSEEVLNLHTENGEDSFQYKTLAASDESQFLEAFDSLYTQLYLLRSPVIRSLIVSSVEPRDGQSTVALYLAMSAASAGRRVLLVDTNYDNPQLHNWLGLSNYKGLIHVLKDRVFPQEIIQSVPNIENLSVLTLGESLPNFPQKLWSPQMENLMEEFSKTYDLVIYDSLHFLEGSDVKFMSQKTDGILMVIGIQKTSQSLVKKALQQIQTLNLSCLGAVANHF